MGAKSAELKPFTQVLLEGQQAMIKGLLHSTIPDGQGGFQAAKPPHGDRPRGAIPPVSFCREVYSRLLATAAVAVSRISFILNSHAAGGSSAYRSDILFEKAGVVTFQD